MEKFLIVVFNIAKYQKKISRTRVWIPLKILCMLRVSNFKFDLQKGLKFLKQAIISYGLNSLYCIST